MNYTFIIETIDTQHRTMPETVETNSLVEAINIVRGAIASKKQVSARRYDNREHTCRYVVVASAWLSATGDYRTSVDPTMCRALCE
jgi:hypothetical protein